jgi:hypothetical protein
MIVHDVGSLARAASAAQRLRSNGLLGSANCSSEWIVGKLDIGKLRPPNRLTSCLPVIRP